MKIIRNLQKNTFYINLIESDFFVYLETLWRRLTFLQNIEN